MDWIILLVIFSFLVILVPLLSIIILRPRVAIASLVRKPVDFPLWLKHHRNIGVNMFFIRLEDSYGWEDYLQLQHDVVFESGTSDKDGNNYETLQSRQVTFVNKCLKEAKKYDITWVFHIDSDELLDGSFVFLRSLDRKYKCLHYENFEALYNDSNNETCFAARSFMRCANRAPCNSYINGKGAGKVDKDVALAGPHYFSYNGNIEGNHAYTVPIDILKVLHFDSCSFGSWAEKYHHLSKTKNIDNIPFKYYKESVEAVEKAFDIYKKYKIDYVTTEEATK